MKPWIKFIPYKKSTGKLRTIYDRIVGSNKDLKIDNILMIHSLRPHSLDGHMRLYKNVLHHMSNTLPKSLLETLGVYVSYLNSCEYCFKHHFAGLKRLLSDDRKAMNIKVAIEIGKEDEYFTGRDLALIRYAKQLTLSPGKMDESYIMALREQDLDDGQILEANQVISYFAYANRTVNGLGVTIKGDILGLSPGDSDNPDNWSHS